MAFTVYLYGEEKNFTVYVARNTWLALQPLPEFGEKNS